VGAALAIRSPVSAGAVGKVAGAIILALLTAILTYAFTARLNVQTAYQQQQATSIQQFEESGAKMDAQLSLLVDALLDAKGNETNKAVDDARSEARTAITLHASQAHNLEPVVGTGNVKQYIDGLGILRGLTDKVTGRITARRMAQVHVNLMDYRVRMLKQARANMYRPSRLDRWTSGLMRVFD